VKQYTFIGIQIDLQATQELARIADFALRVGQLAEPANLLLTLNDSELSFLVLPVRPAIPSSATAVHLLGAEI